RGPVVQQSAGVKSGAPTFQDLLKGPHDEALFEHYLTAQLTRVGLDGSATSIGAPGLHLGATPSPDGRWLLVETLHRPWSYVFPIDRFPRRFQVWRPDGKLARQIADIPLADRVPVTFAAVREGPREFEWRADAPASLCWAEARDGGDPERKAAVRDHLLCLADPTARTPRILARLPLRFERVDWGNAKLALVSEWWWDNRKTRTYVIDPSSPSKRRVLWDRSFEDRYSDPGAPAMKPTPRGTKVLHMTADNRALFLVGDGASPAGDLPFLDRMHLDTGKAERLWRCKAPHYETVRDILDDAATEVVTRRESKSQQPNYVLLSLQGGRRRQITAFPHPAPELAGVEKRLLKYKRKDGVELTGMLYLPPGWTAKKGRLPLLMWAYPQEFKSAQAAGQVQDSPHRFVRLEWWSPLFALLLGYAVLDDPSLPIIGEGAAEPNDTYVDQLVMGAQAAVDEVVRLGVASRDRVAIGGHSYGAFMAANLLAHSDIFRTGIARSGAYNRTLTPFGFQAEERMYWQAPETYHRMSPFSAAHRIDEPILLIHGEADNNPGTYTMQSQRLFEAIKALGGSARLVLLPHESHGYRASESVLHVMWEMARWLETHTRPRKRPPRRVLPPPAVRGARVQEPVNPLNSKGSGVV
ncbi:MAG TPA: prolyl oligopeptidase family serine peptidase, partial [Kofleriaceae bacterium]|nr:prolyl oligopeptidase family serine peptidase [Kofleriaceae bacterium]